MIEQDTVKLLRECDSGVKMGVKSIDDVIGAVHAEPMRRALRESRREHEVLGSEIQSQLQRFHDEGRDPNPMVTAMSWIKTEAKLTADPSDSTVADLMTDGCNMGVKSLNRYLKSQYDFHCKLSNHSNHVSWTEFLIAHCMNRQCQRKT